MTAINRIKALRLEHGLRQIDLANKIGALQSTISQWETGKVEPDIEALIKIASIFETSIDNVLGEESPRPPISSGGTWVPVLGEVAAGIPIEAVEDIVDYEEIDAALAATGDFFGLRIKGSSMEPRIREGDVVIVRKQGDADTGDTVVVLVNGDSATVKRLKKEADGSMWLLPNNPAYDPQHFTPTEITEKPVHIIGKVVELRGSFECVPASVRIK